MSRNETVVLFDEVVEQVRQTSEVFDETVEQNLPAYAPSIICSHGQSVSLHVSKSVKEFWTDELAQKVRESVTAMDDGISGTRCRFKVVYLE